MIGLYPLKGSVKHYDWGGKNFIPQLLNTTNNENKPFAEYWMGIHPMGEAVLELTGGDTKSLKEYAEDLPYLFKILDVNDMLSIQVHPSKKEAEIEFERENKAGIPQDSPNRNYRDPNHKPEFMAALGDFWLLHGFKPEEKLVDVLTRVKELNILLPVFKKCGYPGLYRYVMELEQGEVNKVLLPLIERLLPQYRSGMLQKSQEDFWAAKAALTFTVNENIDRGIFSIYLFNLVFLKKGDGIFQGAGVPHAYLEGQNVEIMANSDNVLRGGLTSKHIDVKELLKHVRCEATWPEIINPSGNGGERFYKTHVPDFALSVFELKKEQETSFTATATEILVITNGIAELSAKNSIFQLQPGKPSAVVFKGTAVLIKPLTDLTIYKATVPVNIG